MIQGTCPACDAPIENKLGAPGFSKKVCVACKEVYWLKHCRWDPVAYTDASFREIFDVKEDGELVVKNPIANRHQQYLSFLCNKFKQSEIGKECGVMMLKMKHDLETKGHSRINEQDIQAVGDTWFDSDEAISYEEWVKNHAPLKVVQ